MSGGGRDGRYCGRGSSIGRLTAFAMAWYRVVGVQVIAGVVRGVEPQRVGRVAHHRVEVDDAVEGAAGADPGVHRLADGLARRGVVPRSLERRQGRAEYPHAPGVRQGDQLLVRRR